MGYHVIETFCVCVAYLCSFRVQQFTETHEKTPDFFKERTQTRYMKCGSKKYLVHYCTLFDSKQMNSLFVSFVITRDHKVITPIGMTTKWAITNLGYFGAATTRSFFSHKYSQTTPPSSPVRARYGVSFVDPASDWYSASVPVIIHVISYNTGSRYNGIWQQSDITWVRSQVMSHVCYHSEV